MRFFTAVLLLSLGTGGMWAEGNPEKMLGSVSRMQAAIDRQRLAVQRQTGASETTGFFTTRWLNAAAVVPADTQLIQAECDPVPESELHNLVLEAAQRESVDPLLIRAIIRRESGGRPCAVSAKGAQGLMQLMPPAQADLGVRNPFDPAENISGGARYIRQMLQRYNGDLRLALAAYNAGPQRVDREQAVPPIPETQAYVTAVLAALEDSQKPEIE